MRFATEEDFIDVYDLFKKNRELLPHIEWVTLLGRLKKEDVSLQMA